MLLCCTRWRQRFHQPLMDGPHSPGTHNRMRFHVGKCHEWKSVSNLYGMAAVQSVQVQSTGIVSRHKLGPDVVFWEAVVHTKVLDPWCKSFIKPQMGPPFLFTQIKCVFQYLYSKWIKTRGQFKKKFSELSNKKPSTRSYKSYPYCFYQFSIIIL